LLEFPADAPQFVFDGELDAAAEGRDFGADLVDFAAKLLFEFAANSVGIVTESDAQSYEDHCQYGEDGGGAQRGDALP
jgi:hypothetical protein